MKKIILLIMISCFSNFAVSQCLSGSQYPADTFVPICDNTTTNVITDGGYAGEYSVVTVNLGQTYIFVSSIATDLLTITSNLGLTADAFAVGTLTWTSTVTGDIRIYKHLNDGNCGYENVPRILTVSCNEQTCPYPTNLTVANITATTATINWVQPNSLNPVGYDYYVSEFNALPIATTIPTGSVNFDVYFANLINLIPATEFNVYVRSNCGTEVGVWSIATQFKTLCAPITPSFTESFIDFIPNCWTLYTAGDETNGPINPTTDTSVTVWKSDGFLNNGDTGAIKASLYYQDRIGFLKSPSFNLSSGGYRLKFNYGITTWAITTPSAMGSDDTVKLVISENDGTTWTVIHTFNAAANISNANNLFEYNLASNLSANTIFGLIATDGTIDDPQDYEFFVDNFTLEPLPVCSEPASILIANISAEAAVISWGTSTSTTAINYEYVLDNSLSNPTLAGTITSNLIFNANFLTPETVYYFHIRTICSNNQYSAWVTQSFTSKPTPPINDNCSGARPLFVSAGVVCTAVTAGTVFGATASTTNITTCNGLADDDVWFSFIATSMTHKISLLNIFGTANYLQASLWSGVDCDNLAQFPNSCLIDNEILVNNLSVGTTYYLRVYTYTPQEDQNTTFDICVNTLIPPINDNLCNAIALGLGAISSSSDYTNVSSTGQISEPVPSCFNGGINGSVWFSFIAPPSGKVKVTTDIAGATLTDTEIAVYDSFGVDCNDLTTLTPAIGCDQDSGITPIPAGGQSNNSILNLVNLVSGNKYYVQVDRYGIGFDGRFGINVIDKAPLSNANFDNVGFASFPNPVVDILNLSYSNNIDKIEIYDILGQELISKKINSNEAAIDLSNLKSGTYLIRLTANEQIKTLKVFKK